MKKSLKMPIAIIGFFSDGLRVFLNKTKRQIIPVFREKGVWKIGA